MTQDQFASHHHSLWLHQAVLRLSAYVTAIGGGHVLDKYPFLLPYIDQVRVNCEPQPDLSALDIVWRTVVQQEEAHLTQVGQSPLLRLQKNGLTAQHILAFILVGLVESDARFSTLFGALHPFPNELFITFGLLDDLLHHNDEPERSTWHIVQELTEKGLLTLMHPQRPRAARTLRVPSAVWDVCMGIDLRMEQLRFKWIPHQTLAEPETLIGRLPTELNEQIQRIPQMITQGMIQGLLLRGLRGSGQLEAISFIAHTLNVHLLHIQLTDLKEFADTCRLAGCLATLLNAVPVLECDLSSSDRIRLDGLKGYRGFFALLLGNEGAVDGQGIEKCLTLQLPPPRFAARQQQWSSLLDVAVNGNGPVVDEISKQYHLTFTNIEQAAQLALAYATLDGRDHIQVIDVQQATRAINQRQFDSLATHLPTGNGWHDLVVSDRTREALHNLVKRCRHRETLLDHLASGFKGMTRGVRALFSGPSGTGKTLAARMLATEIGLDLYRVELSSVVSKYIGETERNLSRLFARAEEQDIVLLLDEGDSLLTGRTDVRSSNDRYANMETNYLLQRLESYDGIILITTNAVNRIDSAFQRRIDVLIEFRPPEAGARQRLWALHMPSNHQLSPDFLWDVALRCNLTGGQIRNAALHATLLSVDAGRPLTEPFLIEGIKREYTKMGEPSPLA